MGDVEGFVDDVMETACGLHNFRLAHKFLEARSQSNIVSKTDTDKAPDLDAQPYARADGV